MNFIDSANKVLQAGATTSVQGQLCNTQPLGCQAIKRMYVRTTLDQDQKCQKVSVIGKSATSGRWNLSEYPVEQNRTN